MNKYFYLVALFPFALIGMEEYLNDYRNVLAIKKLIIETAAQVKQKDSNSALVIETWKTLRHNHQKQTQQGFALEWDSNIPKIIWRLGICEFAGTPSIQGDGEKIFLSDMITTFDARVINNELRRLHTRGNQDIPIPGLSIVTYELRKLNNSNLPHVIFKKDSELIDEMTAKSLCKELETH